MTIKSLEKTLKKDYVISYKSPANNYYYGTIRQNHPDIPLLWIEWEYDTGENFRSEVGFGYHPDEILNNLEDNTDTDYYIITCEKELLQFRLKH
jgi:hypothetical protein